MKNTKEQTLGEEIANAISHGIMALFGVTALILLIIKSETEENTWVQLYLDCQ